MSQASVVVHEVSHFAWHNGMPAAGLSDEINFGNFQKNLDAFANYSSTNPTLAWHDAYTYEFFLSSDPGNP